MSKIKQVTVEYDDKVYNKVHWTKSGLFVRQDEAVGLLVYSPYSGLIFLVHPEDIRDTLLWLEKSDSVSPSKVVANALGVGWKIHSSEGNFGATHYLGDRQKWDRFPWTTHFPILINWFLTGKCPLSCQYCDATDLMRTRPEEPTEEDIRRIAASILSYSPLAVVLTGGEPLQSQYLEECIELLYGQTGIVVDTNGLYLDSRHIELFKRYGVVVRISLDSPIPDDNDRLRCFRRSDGTELGVKRVSSLEKALEALCLCLDKCAPVSVQTVATYQTIHDLSALGDRLYKLGVRFWRVHLVALPPDNNENKEFNKKRRVPLGNREHTLSEVIKLRRRWDGMDFQLVDDISRNAVIIVATDGEYLIESNTGHGKILIDPDSPKAPSLDRIFSVISPDHHAYRYLGDPDIQLRG